MNLADELEAMARDLRVMRLTDLRAADAALSRIASRLEALAKLERIAPDPDMRLADGLDPLLLGAVPQMVVGHPYRLNARLTRPRSGSHALLIEGLTLLPEDEE